jgi:hypothetical protein
MRLLIGRLLGCLQRISARAGCAVRQLRHCQTCCGEQRRTFHNQALSQRREAAVHAHALEDRGLLRLLTRQLRLADDAARTVEPTAGRVRQDVSSLAGSYSWA